MGGNGSFYNEQINGGKNAGQLTHYEYDGDIDGYKIVVQRKDIHQKANIVNSRKADTIYLIASVKKGEIVKIQDINIYKDHKLVESIDLKFDEKGNMSSKSHSHLWGDDNGVINRISHLGTNEFPINDKYMPLISKVVEFNKEKHKWKSRPNE